MTEKSKSLILIPMEKKLKKMIDKIGLLDKVRDSKIPFYEKL